MHLHKYLFIQILFISIVLLSSCKKESPNEPVVEVQELGYSNLKWDGGDNHYWSVYTINIDGTNDKKIIESTIGLSGQEWSPDGTKILVGGMVTPASPASVYVMNADGSNLLKLTQLTDAVLPRWSTDGRKITFTKYFPEQNYRSEVWVMNADGSNAASIIEGTGARFSQNGTKLIFTSNISGNSEIYICNIDGTNPLKLTNSDGDESNVDISPDGTRIIYSMQSNSSDINTLEIYVMNTDGTNVTRLTNNNDLDEQARWSLDGTLIAFCSNRSSHLSPEVFLMNVDGTKVRKITNAYGRSNSANYPSWKPKKN